MSVDAEAVIQHLTRRIAELELDRAILQARIDSAATDPAQQGEGGR